MNKKDDLKPSIQITNVNIFLFLKLHCLYNCIIFLMIFVSFFLVKISKTYLSSNKRHQNLDVLHFLDFLKFIEI